MGGGGHDKVAAFKTTLEDNLTDVKTKLISLCVKQFDKDAIEQYDISKLFGETDETDANSEKKTESETETM